MLLVCLDMLVGGC